MVWGGISSIGKTPLVFVEGFLNGPGYINILKDTYLPWIRRRKVKDAILQQDNAPCHIAKVIKAFLAEKGIQTLVWPPYSPDLNPIENFWAFMKDKVSKVAPATKDELVGILKAEWDKISQAEIDNFVNSMPNRIQACLEAKGGHTRY